MDKPRSFAPIIAAVLLLLPVLYLGSYFALVKPANVFVSGGGQAMSLVVADYRIGGSFAAKLFWPLEQFDRKLRPEAWESKVMPILIDSPAR